MSKRSLITGGVAVVVLAISATARIAVVREDGTPSQVLWSGNEAHVFIGVNQVGYRPTYLTYSLARLGLTPFGARPQDSTPSVVAIRITMAGLLRHVVTNTYLRPMTVVDGQVTDGTTRWTASGPEPLTSDQTNRLSATAARTDYTNVEGWSKRSFVPRPMFSELSIAFELDGRAVQVRVFQTDGGIIAIDLHRQGLQPERLWSSNPRPRYVKAAEYNRLFRR